MKSRTVLLTVLLTGQFISIQTWPSPSVQALQRSGLDDFCVHSKLQLQPIVEQANLNDLNYPLLYTVTISEFNLTQLGPHELGEFNFDTGCQIYKVCYTIDDPHSVLMTGWTQLTNIETNYSNRIVYGHPDATQNGHRECMTFEYTCCFDENKVAHFQIINSDRLEMSQPVAFEDGRLLDETRMENHEITSVVLLTIQDRGTFQNAVQTTLNFNVPMS